MKTLPWLCPHVYSTVREQVRWWVWQSCWFAGFQRTVITGQPHASPCEAPLLVLAPHTSFSDMLPLMAAGAPSIVAKAETAQLPFFGSRAPCYHCRLAPALLRCCFLLLLPLHATTPMADLLTIARTGVTATGIVKRLVIKWSRPTTGH